MSGEDERFLSKHSRHYIVLCNIPVIVCTCISLSGRSKLQARSSEVHVHTVTYLCNKTATKGPLPLTFGAVDSNPILHIGSDIPAFEKHVGPYEVLASISANLNHPIQR
jgi:hypothetical protein